MSQSPETSSIVKERIGGVEVPIFPNSPDGTTPFAQSGPWFYLTPVNALRTPGQFYDTTTRTITICLDTPYETASVEDLTRAKTKVAVFYKSREPANTHISADAVTLQGIPLVGYEITVIASGKEVPIASQAPGDTPISFVNKPTFSSSRVADDATHAVLSAASSQMQIRFVGYYKMRGFVITRVSATLVESVLQQVTESVRSGGKQGFVLVEDVSRDATSDVKSFIQSSLRYEVTRSDQSDAAVVASLKSLMSGALDRYFSSLQPTTVEDATRTGDSFVIWSRDAARLELTPEQFRTLTTSLETSDSFKQAVDSAFAYLSTTATAAGSSERFYKKLRDDLKTNSSANGSLLGIISAGFGFSLENDYEQIDAGERMRIDTFFNNVNTSSALKESLQNASSRKFRGEDWHSNVVPKRLQLYRVSNTDLARDIQLSATDTRWAGSSNVGNAFLFGLRDAPDYYGSIRLGMMIPFFGNDCPEGFVWADGTTSWPTANWVPAHLQGKSVPNMEKHLIGGTNDAVAVGTRFDSGKIVVSGESITGSSFKLPAPTAFRIRSGEGTAGDGGHVILLNRNAGFGGEPFSNNFFGANGGAGNLPGGATPRTADYSSFAGGTAMQGTFELPTKTVALNDSSTLPLHYQTRWIIRIK